MRINYNLKERKPFVQALEEITGVKSVYKKPPTFAYEVDCFTITRDGNLEFDDRADAAVIKKVLEELESRGFFAEVNKPHITDSMRSGFYDSLRVYERPNMPIPMRVLWQRIVENYAEIPVVELTIKSSLQDVYEALRDYGDDMIQRDVTRLGNGYVLLTKTEVEQIVTEMGYSLQEVRTEFALRGLWVTDKNTGGYQKTRKVDKKNRRFYALKTELPSEKDAECKAVNNVAYAETIPHTQENAEIEKLKSELAKMKKERDQMTQIVCDRVPDLTQQEIMTKLL